MEKQTTIEWLEQMYWDNEGIITRKHLEKAKQMEKELIIAFAEFLGTYPDKNRNVNGEILHAKSKYDGAERTIDLLETFKKQL
jgi:hypothetical protein